MKIAENEFQANAIIHVDIYYRIQVLKIPVYSLSQRRAVSGVYDILCCV